MSKIYPRWQTAKIYEALKTRRVLLLSGCRQCGKTTLARELQTSAQAEYLTLDDLVLKNAAEADPQGFVKRRSKMLIIDEVQRVPSLLPAIKMAVDEDTRPGQYLLTGSANIQSLPNVQESLAGRVSKIRLRPLSMGEINSRKPLFLKHAFAQSFVEARNHYDKDDLLSLAFQGGFPEALTLNDRDRKRWHLDYIEALLERDLQDIAKIQRKASMRDLINVLAAWSSKFMEISSIGAGLSIRRPTLESYLNALETLYLVERVPPWTKTDYERVGKQSKLFMTDSGLLTSLLDWRFEQVRLDSDCAGKLIETYIFHELMTQIEAGNDGYRLCHYRDREKREIDFLIERDDGALLGIEVKAGSAIGKSDFKHLKWFRENLLAKNQAMIAIILYAGEHIASFGENLWAIPIGCLWEE